MPELTGEALERMQIDPREPVGRTRCPWCGEDVVLGVRSGTRNLALVHAAHQDPTDPTHTRWVSGCEPFQHAIGQDDVIRRLYNAGARFVRLDPG